MNKDITNENKTNKLLKNAIIIQVLILLALIFILLIKYFNYAYSGNTITDSQPFAKCDFAYSCDCPSFSGKCKCIYYYKNEEPEKIKCNRDPDIN